MKMHLIMLLSLALFITMSWMNCDNSKKPIVKKTDSVIVDSIAVNKYLKDHSPENHSKIDTGDIDPGFNQTKK